MKIGIDIDNVIANTYQDLYAFFDSFMKRKSDPHETIRIMRKHKIKMWFYFYKAWRQKVMTKVSLIDGAAETIQGWSKEHQIYLVTSRYPIFNRQTKWWLKEHKIPYWELHHAPETTKHLKVDRCDIFIEDNLDECEVLADHCERILLFDQPWNQKPIKQKNIIRVKDWEEIRKNI
ncbi:MAG: hypothetical protein HQ596_02455 [Candidatus Saganbacteria bacterium]|nr:hypothetical protein [Candidatus Saganbacteria bacterium]